LISFRTHVVTLVAIMLTLAVGVALGGGPLSEVGRGTLSSATTTEDDKSAVTADFGDTFARSSAGQLYARGLDTHPVAVVTLPGAPEGVASGLTTEIERAGGTLTATYAALPALVDPTEKSLVDTLGSQLMTQLDSDAIDEGAPTYERIGQLLGTAIASTEPTGAPVEDGTTAIRQSLAGAELVTGPEGEPKRAPLVLVVLGDDVDDDVLAGLLAGLAARSVGVVAAGDTAAGSGDLAGLRTSPLAESVATVDGAERDLGRVTAVLALIRALKTPGGSFGASGSDGAVPLG
jgi:hypothetical protein